MRWLRVKVVLESKEVTKSSDGLANKRKRSLFGLKSIVETNDQTGLQLSKLLRATACSLPDFTLPLGNNKSSHTPHGSQYWEQNLHWLRHLDCSSRRRQATRCRLQMFAARSQGRAQYCKEEGRKEVSRLSLVLHRRRKEHVKFGGDH